MLLTLSYGPHPDPRVKEEGLGIRVHVIQCSRSRPRCACDIPVAYISRHAMNRLYERGYDITEKADATNIFIFIGGLGYLVNSANLSGHHIDGGLSLAVSNTLVVGALHRFTSTNAGGRPIGEVVFDVRTVLAVDEAGPGQQPQIEQGRIACEVSRTG
jgi:hypothetical protein